jgi:hypothetical protein
MVMFDKWAKEPHEQPRCTVAECLRGLHPLHQLEHGVGSITYLAACVATGVDLYLWIARQPNAPSVLGACLVLWLCVLAGVLLTVWLTVDDPRDEIRREIQHMHGQNQVQSGAAGGLSRSEEGPAMRQRPRLVEIRASSRDCRYDN